MTVCQEPTEWDVLNDNSVLTVLALYRARNHLWDKNQKMVQQHGLTWSQFVTLTALRQTPAPHRLMPSQLYAPVQVTSGGLTKILNTLQHKKYITRQANPSDRRSQFVMLTDAGFELVSFLSKELQLDLTAQLTTAFSKAEQAEFSRLITQMCDRLDVPV